MLNLSSKYPKLTRLSLLRQTKIPQITDLPKTLKSLSLGMKKIKDDTPLNLLEDQDRLRDILKSTPGLKNS